MRQIFLFKSPEPVHGGELNRGRRKFRRPLDRKKALHLVLKSRRRDLPKHRAYIQGELNRQATKFGLKIYDHAVAHDHIHFLAKLPGRREYVAFIRALTGILAKKLGKGLWLLKPFSRVAEWGRDFAQLKSYLLKNREESRGVRPYTPRKDWYRKLRDPSAL